MLQYPQTAGAILRASLLDDHFYCAHNRDLFQSIKDNHEKGEVAIVDQCMKSRPFVGMGGESYFDSLKSTKISDSKVGEVQDKLSQMMFCRRVMDGTSELFQKAQAGEYDDANRELNEFLDRLGESKSTTVQTEKVGDVLGDVFEELRQLSEGTMEVGKSIGLPRLDRETGGLISEMIMIGGPTSSGKSALMNQFMLANCIDHKQTGVVFSYEMTKKQLIKRMLAKMTGVSLKRLSGLGAEGGKIVFTKHELNLLKRAATELRDANLFIEDDPTLNVDHIWSKCSEIKARTGNMGCIAVDYMQLVPPLKGNNREQEISSIGIELKRLSMFMDCPVLALTQLNQDMSARESKALEMHAGNFYKVHRGEDPITKAPIEDEHLYIWKNRNGERFLKIPISFDGDTQRFMEV